VISQVLSVDHRGLWLVIFGEGDLHHVLFELGKRLAADHAVLVAQRPTFLGNVVTALTAEVGMG
jgi:hypothetical protein